MKVLLIASVILGLTQCEYIHPNEPDLISGYIHPEVKEKKVKMQTCTRQDNNKVIKHGAGYKDECNVCACNDGEIKCTSKKCEVCIVKGSHYLHGASWRDSVYKCRTCVCNYGKAVCTDVECADKCYEKGTDKQLAKHGQTINDGCNTCKCLFGKLECTNLVCKKSCKIDGRMVAHGVQYKQGCDSCMCDNGKGKCTKNLCPKDCKVPKSSKIIKHGQSAANGCNTCSCQYGKLSCTGLKCTSSCMHNNATIPHGKTFKQDCDICGCSFGKISCVKRACDKPCTFNNKTIGHGKTVMDKCNLCQCDNGKLSCTKNVCPGPCTYNNGTYAHGKKWKDGCNNCQCYYGKSACTKLSCVTSCIIQPTGPLKLRSASLSTTASASTGAYRAIDGDAGTYGATDQRVTTGHWLTVSMDLATVHQVILYGFTMDFSTSVGYGVYPIWVSLYKGGRLVGTCDSHPGTVSTVTLSCDTVEADMVKMSFTGTDGYLLVYEVEVIGTTGTTETEATSNATEIRHGGTWNEGCNVCGCNNGKVTCSDMGCATNCTYNGVEREHGTSFLDGCNQCQCEYNKTSCTQNIQCPEDCLTDEGVPVPHGKTVKAGVNYCVCRFSQLICTDIKILQCMEGGEVLAGEGEVISKDCNKCICSKGKLLCTQFKCE